MKIYLKFRFIYPKPELNPKVQRYNYFAGVSVYINQFYKLSMPFNPQSKAQSNYCQQLLAKFTQHQEHSQSLNESTPNDDKIQITEGKWDDEQNLNFIIFIDFHSKIFSSKQKRKSQKIFKSLSKHLVIRTPAQCRSHFQKLMIKFKTVAKLKKHFRELFGQNIYDQRFKSFVESQKQLNPNQTQQNPQKQIKEIKDAQIQTDPVMMLDSGFQQMIMLWQMHQWNMSFYVSPYIF